MYNHAAANYVCPLCLVVKGQPANCGDQEADVGLAQCSRDGLHHRKMVAR